MTEISKIVIAPSEGELFKKILGPEWKELHPDIQRRFDKNPALDKPLHYTGTLTELNCSRIGKLLGYITQPLIQGALIPFNDADFPVDIQVYSEPNSPAIFKKRIYWLNGRKPIQFTSYMQESSCIFHPIVVTDFRRSWPAISVLSWSAVSE